MNVLIFSPNLKPVCGRTIVAIALGERLAENAINSTYATNPESDKDLCNYLENRIVYIPCNPNKKSIVNFIKCIYLLRKTILENAIDIVNPHHRYAELLALVTKKIFRMNTKIVISVHSFTFDKKLFSYKGDKLIAVSRAVKNHLVSYYGINENKIEIIYNGIESTKEVLEETKNDDVIILAFGRFEYEKGFDVFLNATELLKYSGNYKIVIVGVGTEKANLIELSNKCKRKVEFLESKTTPWQQIKKADIIIVPSRIESLGICILEAGIECKCVIATNVGGIPEIIEDGKTGLLFERDDAKRLAELIDTVLENEILRNKLGALLKEKVELSFTQKLMLEKYSSLFEEVSKSADENI